MRWAVWVGLGLLVGCGGTGRGGGGGTGGTPGGGGSGVPKCVPGDSKSCAGPGACVGYQVCGVDGTYGACVCGGGGTAGAGGTGGSAGGAGGAGGSTGGGGGRGGMTDSGVDASSACPTDPAVAATVFATQLDELATAICDREQRCGAADADYAACVDQWRQSWASMWADECRRSPVPCPNGIPEARFQGICVDVPRTLVPCTAMHGIITYLEPSCELFEICNAVVTPQDGGGQ